MFDMGIQQRSVLFLLLTYIGRCKQYKFKVSL